MRVTAYAYMYENTSTRNLISFDVNMGLHPHHSLSRLITAHPEQTSGMVQHSPRNHPFQTAIPHLRLREIKRAFIHAETTVVG